MFIIIFYLISNFSSVLSASVYPISYVYRSDGSDLGYERTFLSGKTFTQVIVKLPLTVNSHYSAFIKHPVETIQENSFYQNDVIHNRRLNKHGNWAKNDGSGAQVTYFTDTNANDNIFENERNDDDCDSDDDYDDDSENGIDVDVHEEIDKNLSWSKYNNVEDVDNRVSKFFDDAEIVRKENDIPKYWFDGSFYEEQVGNILI